MRGNAVLEALWSSSPSLDKPPDMHLPRGLSAAPPAARRYLEHAIAPGAPLATAVRLTMHGEIRLKGWFPFSAEQVIHWDRGMIWQAPVHVYGIPVRGSDSLLNNQGASRWKALGFIPVANASGPDATRSVAGRLNIESLWLPSVLCGDSVVWTSSNPTHAHAHFTAHGETADIDYSMDDAGALTSVNMPRWGNPNSPEFRYVPCGGFIDEERTFQGYTIPSRLRVGWHFGSPRFAQEGEFFRATIDTAVYR
jgi:hypothetical protein